MNRRKCKDKSPYPYCIIGTVYCGLSGTTSCTSNEKDRKNSGFNTFYYCPFCGKEITNTQPKE
jgi:hypothetical protein